VGQHYLETKPQKQLDEGELFYSSSGTLKFKMVAHIPGKKWEDKPEITEEERKLFIKQVWQHFHISSSRILLTML
jgi:O-acetyl-ADP-ribose deacetylase (regulator of RNase III)